MMVKMHIAVVADTAGDFCSIKFVLSVVTTELNTVT